ncbi:MAG: GTPase Era [Bacteroidota bacterium]
MTKVTHKSGFVSIIGKPNAGKSTLLNQILGRKLVIATPKAQTTRHRIFGIDSDDNYQIVYSDTPGLIRPRYKLQERMVGSINQSLEDADLILLIIAADESFPEDQIVKLAEKTEIPKILVLNKMDAVKPEKLFKRMEAMAKKVDFVEAIPISALKGSNVDKLKELVIKYLPEGPPYFDKEQISDRPERFFIAEMIREKIFMLMRQELPYSTEVVIDAFDEDEENEKITINATIHVTTKQHKGMVIGKGAKNLKKIGTMARKDIETFLQSHVHLDLYVRVSEGWKDSDFHLRGFGYS